MPTMEAPTITALLNFLPSTALRSFSASSTVRMQNTFLMPPKLGGTKAVAPAAIRIWSYSPLRPAAVSILLSPAASRTTRSPVKIRALYRREISSRVPKGNSPP